MPCVEVIGRLFRD